MGAAVAVVLLLAVACVGGVSAGSRWQQLLLRLQHHHSSSTQSSHSSSGGGSGGGTAVNSTEVLHLPGFYGHSFPSRHWAGRITVDEESGRQLYYYFVSREPPPPPPPQQQQPPTAGGYGPGAGESPLIVWLTGGPGCSSMDAWTYEHGPFTFSAPAAKAAGRPAALHDLRLTPNPHSWSKSAHVLYIDSPAGTGFSYTPGQQGPYTTDDGATIGDLQVLVAGFFRQHPELARLPLYIAGESFGGVFVPLLARRLLHHNQRVRQQQAQERASLAGSSAAEHFVFNLTGYIVGNAVTDDAYDGPGQVEYAMGHGLIDASTRDAVTETCEKHGWHVDEDGTPCTEALDNMAAGMGPVNKYNVYGECFHPAPAPAAASSSSQRVSPSRRVLSADHLAQASTGAGSSSSRRRQRLRHTISCADRRLALLYFNSPSVRTALHAPSHDESGRWEPCSDVLHYDHTPHSMVPVHRELLDAGLRALVLSGDADYIVPFTGTRAWVYGALGLRETKPWHSWSTPRAPDQVAGYAVRFERGLLTLATVKGGGHMVPQTHPEAALALLRLWLEGQEEEQGGGQGQEQEQGGGQGQEQEQEQGGV